MKRLKQVLIIFLTVLVVGLGFSTSADFGPKPTSTIEIIGIDDPYYFDLLFPVEDYIAQVLDEEEIQDVIEYNYYRDDFPEELNGYYDEDGYASYTLYRDIPHRILQYENNEHLFHVGYVAPPYIFKIVLVTESGDLIVSPIIEKTLFNAYFVFDLTDFSITESESSVYDFGDIYYPVEGTLQEDYHIDEMIIWVIITVIMTLLIEGVILWAFKYKSKSTYLIALYINLATQSLLYSALQIGNAFASTFGWIAVLLIGEIIVFSVEMIAYSLLFKEHTKKRAILYAVTANLASMLAGITIGSWLLSLLI